MGEIRKTQALRMSEFFSPRLERKAAVREMGFNEMVEIKTGVRTDGIPKGDVEAYGKGRKNTLNLSSDNSKNRLNSL